MTPIVLPHLTNSCFFQAATCVSYAIYIRTRGLGTSGQDSEYEMFLSQIPGENTIYQLPSLKFLMENIYRETRLLAFGSGTSRRQEDASEFLWKLLEKGALKKDYVAFSENLSARGVPINVSVSHKGTKYLITKTSEISDVLAKASLSKSPGRLAWKDNRVVLMRGGKGEEADSLDLQEDPPADERSGKQFIFMSAFKATTKTRSVCGLLEATWSERNQEQRRRVRRVGTQVLVEETCFVEMKLHGMFLLVQFVCDKQSIARSWDYSGTAVLGGKKLMPIVIVSYRGSGLSGHYVAYSRCGDSWLLYDDLVSGGKAPKRVPGPGPGYPSLVLFCVHEFF